MLNVFDQLMKIRVLFLVGLLAAASIHADGMIPYTDCGASVTNGTFNLVPLPKNRLFNFVLQQCAVEPGSSTHESYKVSGRVVSNNSGTSQEGVAVSVGAPGQAPRLVAITDTDGSFRFNVWINSKPKPAFPQQVLNPQPTLEPAVYSPVVLPSIAEGNLCLGGSFGPNRLMVSGTVVRYSFGDLKVSPKKSVNEK